MTRQAPGMVASVDSRRPVPTFLFAGRAASARRAASAKPRFAAADQAALAYLDQYRGVYQLDRAAVATAEVSRVHETGRDTRIVQLRQRVGGREVYGTRMSFLVDRDMDLVAISGHLQPGSGSSWTATLDGQTALARAIADVTGAAVAGSTLSVVDQDGGQRTTRITGDGAAFNLPQPALVREVFYPLPRSLVPAFSVSVEVGVTGSTSSRAYEYVIAANDGRILERRNLTFSEARRYRVWADGADQGYRPGDGPHGDLTPHPTGDVNTPIEVIGVDDRIMAEVEGLNTNPDGAADAWLPDGATDLTAGNNVSAYADHRLPNGFSEGDGIAAQNGQGDFAYNYNLALGPINGNTQVRTAIAQLFFVNNWLHDWWYDSGFTEATGNAQLDNYDRGGVGGDAILAEAQDTRGGERNNANMSTPPDGMSPRMQMYIFDGPVTPIGETSFEITAPPELAGEYPVQGSTFGVDDLVSASAGLTLVDDGVDPSGTDGCEAFTGVAGSIAVVTRGVCTFVQKAQNAEAAGAVALLVINNDPADPDGLPGMGGVDRDLAIPAVGISLNDGTAIATALAAGPVTADVTRAGRDRDLDRDGTIDNAIVAHEWGHYLHNRLTLCGNAQCGAMGEGWGDFVALHMMLRDGDDLHATYGAAAWATDDAYFGIRRVPYSVEFDRNALTFGHVVDGVALPSGHPIQGGGPNSEVHNAGEVWATMLLEVFVALVETEPALPFDEAHRRMGDYIVAGMMLAPPSPTFTEQRDGILAAIAATGEERDLQAAAQAFARRGAGTGAVSPVRESSTFEGVVETFGVSGDLAVSGAEVALGEDCDEDENLDGGETGQLLVTVVNGGPVTLTGTTVSLPEAPEGISFPDGLSATIETLRPYQSAEVAFAIEVDGDVDGIQSVSFSIRAANEGSFNPTVDAPLVHRVNIDDSAASAKVDDVESRVTVWEPVTLLGDAPGWVRADGGDNAVWHADDPGLNADQTLTSPALSVGEDPFVVEFDHRFQFEASPDPAGNIIYWDGAVIEFSTDAGKTWTDVSTVMDPGYGGTLLGDPEAEPQEGDNPLGGRPGFVGESAGFLKGTMIPVTLDFGTALAGQEVLVRFRVGSDAAVGAAGWDLDNLTFEGIENSPFTTLVTDEGTCATPGDDGADDGADDGGGGGPEDDGCGCRSSGSSAPLGLLLYAAVLLPFLRRRRRRA